MNYGQAIDRAREKLSAKASKVLPDVCSFSRGATTETRDDHGEVTTADEEILEDEPCEVLSLSAYERMTGGKVTEGATNKLKLRANAGTLAITGGYRGTIQARGATPKRSFEVTGQLTSSTDLFCFLAIVVG